MENEFTYLGIRFKPYGKCENLPKDQNKHFMVKTSRCLNLITGNAFEGWSYEGFYEAANSTMDIFLMPDYYNFLVIPAKYSVFYYAPVPEEIMAYEARSAYALRCRTPISTQNDPKGKEKYYIHRDIENALKLPLAVRNEAMFFSSEDMALNCLYSLPGYINYSSFESERITLFEQIRSGILNGVDNALGRPPLKTEKELRCLEKNVFSSDRQECYELIGKPYSILREILTTNPTETRMFEIEFENGQRMRVYPNDIGGH